MAYFYEGYEKCQYRPKTAVDLIGQHKSGMHSGYKKQFWHAIQLQIMILAC
jgi:hypothetical protein